MSDEPLTLAERSAAAADARLRVGMPDWARRAAVGGWDAIAATVSYLVVAAIAQGLGMETPIGARLSIAFGLISIAFLGLSGAYRSIRIADPSAARMLITGLLAAASVLVVADLTGLPARPSLLLPTGILAAALWLLGHRVLEFVPASNLQPTLVVGTPDEVAQFEEAARLQPSAGIVIVGSSDASSAGPGGPPVERVVVMPSAAGHPGLAYALREAEDAGARIDVVAPFHSVVGVRPSFGRIGPLPTLSVNPTRPSRIGLAAKRAGDIILGSILLVIASPVLLGIALAIKLDDRGPVFFRQTRTGRFGREFTVLKFRTMSVRPSDDGIAAVADAADSGDLALSTAEIAMVVAEVKSAEGDRVTTPGRFLRRFSLDELPQLVHVVTGSMSLVGPRPLRPFETATLEPWQAERNLMRPGLTGLWQVMGRSEIDWDERMLMDYDYIRHWSPALDLHILVRTVGAVVTGRGAQ